MTTTYVALAELLIANDVFVEESGGLRLNYGNACELGMNKQMLHILKGRGVKILTASDAHKPKDVGANIIELLDKDDKIRRDKEKYLTNRLEIVRNYIDNIFLNVTDANGRRCEYLHSYGVAQACTLIALKRNENAELATMTGMLHDIYSLSKGDSCDHAHKGAILAREILTELKIVDEKEMDIICSAIYNHSDKEKTHCSFDEVLIDADVLQHCLYTVGFNVKEHEKKRFQSLKVEFGLV